MRAARLAHPLDRALADCARLRTVPYALHEVRNLKVVVSLLALVLLAGCGAEDQGSGPPTTTVQPETPAQTETEEAVTLEEEDEGDDEGKNGEKGGKEHGKGKGNGKGNGEGKGKGKKD